MNKISRLYILLLLVFSAGGLALADSPTSSLDDKPSVDTATNAEVQEPALPPGATAGDTQTSYLYDLKKLIDKSRDNIKEVNEKIKEQAVLKRNQKREERAHEYYEKGVELTSEGKLDEARDYFEKAIRITEHPEMVGYIKESQRRLRKQENALHAQEQARHHQIKADENSRKEDVEAAYKQAVDLYKQKKYHPAKDAFEHVDELIPDYRATNSYLKIIDQDITVADALAAKQQSAEIARQQKEAEAARAKEKEMWRQQLDEKEKERKEQVEKQAREVYDEAVALYKNKKYAEAKKKFQEVSWVIPDYKATMKYLARIDKDAQEEQERVAREQEKAKQEQQWEQEVEQKKQEAEKKQKLEAAERQHKKELQDQAQFLYQAAVTLYDHKKMDEALGKFNDIEKLSPDFKSTRSYIARIAKASQVQPAQGPKERADQIEKTYSQALQLYRDQQWQESRDQFESIEQKVPDYKSTRRYLQKIDSIIAKVKKAEVQPTVIVPSVPVKPPAPASPPVAAKPPQAHHSLFSWFTSKPAAVAPVRPASPTPPPTPPAPLASPVKVKPQPPVQISLPLPVQIKPAMSLEDQQKQAQDIAALVDRSAELYRQIADIANDSPTNQVKRKMAELDRILNNLKESKDRLIRQMRDEQWKHQQELSKEKQEERRLTAERIYHDGVGYYRSKDYIDAKIKFMALENIIPDYRGTRSYLNHIEEYQRQTGVVETVIVHENVKEPGQIQQVQEKPSIEEQQQAALRDLAQKSSDIDDDIIRLSKTQDYEGMKAKFADLEKMITALTTLKNQMLKEKDREAFDRKMARESIQRRYEILKEQKQEEKEYHTYYKEQPSKENRPVVSKQPYDAEEYKRRDILKEQNMLYSEGVDLYRHQKYTQAKLIFGELAGQHDPRAEGWLKKVDHGITQEFLKTQAGAARERTAFLADQLKAQRELLVIQERERQRQKKLTEELERQKRLYEDDRLQQYRKEELLKAQDRERQVQEAKRLKLEKESEKEDDLLRFHKIKTSHTQPMQPAVPAPAAPAKVVEPVAAVPSALTPQQIEKKHREELLRQQKEEREEKIKQAQIMREENKNMQEMQRQERQGKSDLEAKREAIRKQLEDGVEAMYQEALGLYKHGNYSAAADKFKDVLDILPGYKRSEQYMDDSRRKSSDPSGDLTDTAASSTVAVPSQSSREDDVSKALDIFDPNAK